MISLFNMVMGTRTEVVRNVIDVNGVFNASFMSTVMRRLANIYYPTSDEIRKKGKQVAIELVESVSLITKVAKDFNAVFEYSTNGCNLDTIEVSEVFSGRNLTVANALVREGWQACILHVNNDSCPFLRGLVKEGTHVWRPDTDEYNLASDAVRRNLLYHGSLRIEEVKGPRGGTYSVRLRKQLP